MVQLPLDTTKAPVALAYDEYGNPENSTTATRYDWLGAQQRSSETVTGTVLMGARLYDPALGRFLSTDPVPGTDTAYDYAGQDPVNQTDLLGTYRHWKISWHWTYVDVKFDRMGTNDFLDYW